MSKEISLMYFWSMSNKYWTYFDFEQLESNTSIALTSCPTSVRCLSTFMGKKNEKIQGQTKKQTARKTGVQH